MVFLYYTGAPEVNQPQTQIQRSLGGNRSSTRVPNNDLNALFTSVSKQELEKGAKQIIGVVLSNESGAEINDITLYATVPDGSTTKFFVAAVTLSGNKIEQIPHNNSTPYVGTLVDMTGVGNIRTLAASIPDGGAIGLWIQRVIEKVTPATTDELWTDYQQNGLPSDEPITEDITMVFQW